MKDLGFPDVLIIEPPQPVHEHSWRLTEKGYVRSWSTEILADGTVYCGSEDFSEDGDGYLYLECLWCGVQQGVEPDRVDWR